MNELFVLPCDSGGCRSGMVSAHSDPGEGCPFGSGGERPSGSSPDWIWKDGCLCCTCHTADPGLQTGEYATQSLFLKVDLTGSLLCVDTHRHTRWVRIDHSKPVFVANQAEVKKQKTKPVIGNKQYSNR